MRLWPQAATGMGIPTAQCCTEEPGACGRARLPIPGGRGGGRGAGPTPLRNGREQSPLGEGLPDPPATERGGSSLRWGTPPALPETPESLALPRPRSPPRRGPAVMTPRGAARGLGKWGDPPVKEGGEQPPQQHLVLHPGTEVAVHQLAACDVDTGACGRQTGHSEALAPAGESGVPGPATQQVPPRPGPRRARTVTALRPCHSRSSPWWHAQRLSPTTLPASRELPGSSGGRGTLCPSSRSPPKYQRARSSDSDGELDGGSPWLLLGLHRGNRQPRAAG